MTTKPTSTDPQVQHQLDLAFMAGSDDGFNRAFNRNKWQVNFVRGIPVGIPIGIFITLAVQKFLMHMF